MIKFRLLTAAALVCGGGFLLCGCHHDEAGSVPAAVPHAPPSVQAQSQEIDNNPHIPDAQKAAIKANIANTGSAAGQPPAQKP